MLSLLLHIFCLCNQIIDLPTSKDLPQEAEILQFGAQNFIFSFEPVVGGGKVFILPIEPPVGVVQPVVAVQCLIIVVEHLSDNFFQFLNEWVNESLLIGFGRHQRGWIRKLIFAICFNPLLQLFNRLRTLIEVVDPTLHFFQLVLLFGKRAVQRSEFFLSFLLLVIQNGKMLFVGAFLLPPNVIPLHHGSKLLLFGLYPLCPFRCTMSAALEALRRQRLFQRYTGIKSTLAPSGEWHKVDVQMGRGLVHMEVRREHPQIWIPCLKALIIFVQNLPCQLCILAGGAHIVLISNLQDDLVKGLLLIAGTDFFIVVWNAPVCTGLLLVIPFQSLIEKLVVYGLDALVAVVNVQVCAASVHILCLKFAAVMVDRAFTDLGTDRSLHKISLPFKNQNREKVGSAARLFPERTSSRRNEPCRWREGE